jgi:FKBP-type peptidyl-prolyl cis-trans isomerase FkpA
VFYNDFIGVFIVSGTLFYFYFCFYIYFASFLETHLKFSTFNILRMQRLLIFILPLIFFTACNRDVKYQHEIDEDKIVAYVEKHKLNATRTSSGLYYVIDTLGIGDHPLATSNVTVAYKGYFTDESVFDQSDSAGITFNLGQVIKGWTEGIPYFKPGGKGKLLIPSELGYGNRAINGIPAGSVLIFDIHLIDIK